MKAYGDVEEQFHQSSPWHQMEARSELLITAEEVTLGSLSRDR
jgi:hypothetical protein